MLIQLIVLENFVCVYDSDNDGHGDLNEMVANTDNCDEDSDKDF